jgi:hypothetical protein
MRYSILLFGLLLGSQLALGADQDPGLQRQRLLQASLGANPCVQVRDSVQVAPEGQPLAWEIPVVACSDEMARGLASVLQTQVGESVSVKILNQKEQQVAASDESDVDTVVERFQDALDGNPFFASAEKQEPSIATVARIAVRFKPGFVLLPVGDSSVQIPARDVFRVVLKKHFGAQVPEGFWVDIVFEKPIR